jgi:hypothetical protein
MDKYIWPKTQLCTLCSPAKHKSRLNKGGTLQQKFYIFIVLSLPYACSCLVDTSRVMLDASSRKSVQIYLTSRPWSLTNSEYEKLTDLLTKFAQYAKGSVVYSRDWL